MQGRFGFGQEPLSWRFRPSKLWAFLVGGRRGLSALARETLLVRLLDVSRSDVRRILREIQTSGFRDRLASRKGPGFRGQIFYTHGEFLYALCRFLRPHVVVETGVGPGVSSAYLLAGLHRNETGKLHSIDLASHEPVPDLHGNPVVVVPDGEDVGWVVPEELRNRWVLHRGRSEDLLGPLLREIGAPGLFVHDSDHRYENMRWEFDTAWRMLLPGGFLVSDDVSWNEAFQDFAMRARANGGILDRRLGVLRKAALPLESNVEIPWQKERPRCHAVATFCRTSRSLSCGKP